MFCEVLASIAPGYPAEHKRMRETRTPQLYLYRLPSKKEYLVLCMIVALQQGRNITSANSLE